MKLLIVALFLATPAFSQTTGEKCPVGTELAITQQGLFDCLPVTRICTGSCMIRVGEDNDVQLAPPTPNDRLIALEARVLALEKKDSVSREYSASLARQVQQLMSANADLQKRLESMQPIIDHLADSYNREHPCRRYYDKSLNLNEGTPCTSSDGDQYRKTK